MQVLLVPGLWLDASSWSQVEPGLVAAGHRPQSLTLPGLDAVATDRRDIGLADQVAAVVAAVDAVDPSEGPVVLVGHSAGAAVAHAAVDARPDRVARAIYVGGFPTGDGDAIAEGFPTEDGDLPLPAWDAFEDEEVADLDAAARDAFRTRAVPSPARLTTDVQRLGDERRYAVPVTVICPEFDAATLRRWIDAGEGPVRELARIEEVELIDLPAGHWPQFTRPDDLAATIVAAVEGSSS